MRPDLLYSRGWSRGIQKIKGEVDNLVGSYYINSCADEAQVIREEDKHLFTED